MSNIRAAVIGVGKLGFHHARIYAGMKGVDLVGVVDSDDKKGKQTAIKFNTNYYADYRDLIGKVDAVNIVVPTLLHYEAASFFLKNKIHCLVEKPITTDLKEAQELADIAGANGVVLQVGHIERFNPAVLEAQKYIKAPKFIEVNRLGPYDPRVSQVGVVLDLMIHDLDILLFLTGSKVKSIDAVGTKLFSNFEDIANVRLKFENNCVANVSASRVSIKKTRKIRIFQDDSYISLNYQKQTLVIYKKKKEKVDSFKDIQMLKPRIKKNEPLLLEIEDFIRCVKGQIAPVVSGIHAMNALELALEIGKEIESNY
ncbi:MAG: Gfo/Idh/MocA family oxidoreductase [Elusimicrobiota bacterium]